MCHPPGYRALVSSVLMLAIYNVGNASLCRMCACPSDDMLLCAGGDIVTVELLLRELPPRSVTMIDVRGRSLTADFLEEVADTYPSLRLLDVRLCDCESLLTLKDTRYQFDILEDCTVNWTVGYEVSTAPPNGTDDDDWWWPLVRFRRTTNPPPPLHTVPTPSKRRTTATTTTSTLPPAYTTPTKWRSTTTTTTTSPRTTTTTTPSPSYTTPTKKVSPSTKSTFHPRRTTVGGETTATTATTAQETTEPTMEPTVDPEIAQRTVLIIAITISVAFGGAVFLVIILWFCDVCKDWVYCVCSIKRRKTRRPAYMENPNYEMAGFEDFDAMPELGGAETVGANGSLEAPPSTDEEERATDNGRATSSGAIPRRTRAGAQSRRSARNSPTPSDDTLFEFKSGSVKSKPN